MARVRPGASYDAISQCGRYRSRSCHVEVEPVGCAPMCGCLGWSTGRGSSSAWTPFTSGLGHRRSGRGTPRPVEPTAQAPRIHASVQRGGTPGPKHRALQHLKSHKLDNCSTRISLSVLLTVVACGRNSEGLTGGFHGSCLHQPRQCGFGSCGGGVQLAPPRRS